jgi:DNA polymerase III subunit epsilon
MEKKKRVIKKTMEKKNVKKKKPETIQFNRLAAIDFETADYGRDSACALAVVIGEKGKIVKKAYSPIRPPRRDFVFSYLHGITWQDVKKKPSFQELWPEFEELLIDVDFIAAHNASFDRSVLHTCCEATGHKPPDKNYLCTMKLARRVWNIRPTKLSDVCRHFQIQLNHHDAASDALACARIVLQTMEKGVPTGAMLKKN